MGGIEAGEGEERKQSQAGPTQVEMSWEDGGVSPSKI